MSVSYCHYLRDGHGKYIFMPACTGGAVNGPEACTCLMPDERLDLLEKRFEALTIRLRDIENYLMQCNPAFPTPSCVHRAMNEFKTTRKRDGKQLTLVGNFDRDIEPNEVNP